MCLKQLLEMEGRKDKNKEILGKVSLGGGGGVDDTEYSSVVKTIALPVNYKMPQVAQCQKFIWR
jgi:hypothetical protein